MEIHALAQLVSTPEIHRRLLTGYKGGYSLGVGEDPNPIGDPSAYPCLSYTSFFVYGGRGGTFARPVDQTPQT